MGRSAARRLAEQDPTVIALERGVEHLVSLQGKDGAWTGDYGGPMFLLPMYVAANHIARREIPAARRSGFVSHIRNVQNPDGSVGLHAEGEGCMFTTVLCYVALRLLGVPSHDRAAARMLAWTRANGTALGSASWGKLILSLLNLYDYRGLHPILPELWSLPRALPIHPGRFWCHCRQVYLPMAYLYGTRAAMPVDDLILELRSELYDRPYDQIRFEEHRDTLCKSDSYIDGSSLLGIVNRITGLYERFHSPIIRSQSLIEVLDHINYEDRATRYIRIGPVNAVLNTLVHHFLNPASEATKKSFAALDAYIWDGPDGSKMNGYNSTALWDTVFATQAILETPHASSCRPALIRAYEYIRDNQVVEDLPDADGHFRHRCKGGWPFSDRAHGWPITDCTAEGLKCALALEGLARDTIPEELLEDSVDLILSFQNPGGGWSTYERQRGARWLECLNPSQVFADIVVDYPYVECTSACVQALIRARERFPGRYDREIERAVKAGVRFIRNRQRQDGSFEGSWAVCFTYGTWFAVWGLTAAGVPSSDRAVQRSLNFLVERQNRDGGWGEHYTSCIERRYIPGRESHVVNTAWALLTLVRGGRGGTQEAKRAVRYLVDRQLDNGDWPAQSMVGVFNKTALINYDNYRRYFPVWALAAFARSTS